MIEEPKEKELDCSKNCKNVMKECTESGVDASTCGNRYNRCISYCPMT
jgi:hypothetical protein